MSAPCGRPSDPATAVGRDRGCRYRGRVDLRTILRGLGKTCISAGTLILLFVAFQLWGTGIAESHAQDRLRHQFGAPLSAAPHPLTTAPVPTTAGVPTTAAGALPGADTPTTVVRPDPGSAGPSTTLAPLPPPPTGAAVAIMKIPRIGVNAAVVEGVGVEDLKQGPGHYPGSPMPGQAGNAAVAGHRTTYGAPFYRLDELKAGDDIYVATRDAPNPWHYQVMSTQDVSPSSVDVLNDFHDNRLTLTTCTPRFTAAKRLIVVARLLGAIDPRPPVAAAPPIAAAVGQAASAGLSGDVGSLSGQGTSVSPAVAWGLACAAIWAAAWLFGRHRRRWLAYAVAAPLFGVCLFFFFENFARFVPANI